ncbi:RNA polymerase sigma-B factor [Arthrobacter sp. V4I6]|nr:RNA polymerase sigma-B factor [Arthrobacter sp. V1I7]MDQ0853839.1 RNA polymerase sigma-B factor [Arthrobacter sp. V4I6]
MAHLDLAESLARRYARGRDQADLRQVAYLGLIKAAHGFDAERGGSFPAYAAPTIRGELKKYLRDHCWVVRPPRPVQDLRTLIMHTAPALAQALGRAPTDEELAKELGTGSAEVREAQMAHTSMRPDSIDASGPDGTGPSLAGLPAPDSEADRLEELIALGQAMRGLSDADRNLLYHRYSCEETQAALGVRFGMTQMQVSRRLAKILVQLQRALLDPEPGSETISSSKTS